MPIYEYQCEHCGFEFEHLHRRVTDSREMECEECGEMAKRIPSATNFSFAHKPVGGPRPQNTGVHSIDYSFDQVIGRDAEEKHRLVEARQAYKRKVIKDNPGSTGHDLSRTPDGDYRVMKPQERQLSEQGRAQGLEVVRQAQPPGKTD